MTSKGIGNDVALTQIMKNRYFCSSFFTKIYQCKITRPALSWGQDKIVLWQSQLPYKPKGDRFEIGSVSNRLSCFRNGNEQLSWMYPKSENDKFRISEPIWILIRYLKFSSNWEFLCLLFSSSMRFWKMNKVFLSHYWKMTVRDIYSSTVKG